MVLDHLIQLVLAEYDLGEITGFRHLFSSVNDTYAVEFGATSYALRVHRADPWWIGHDDELRFELDLLHHLHGAGINVPVPIERTNGDPLGRLENGRHYSLFSWAPGKPGEGSPKRVGLVGETLARIHVASDGFQSPYGRYHLDEANLLDRYLAKLRPTDGQAAYIEEHAAEIRRRLATFDPGPTGWGVVHGDVQSLNFHFTDDDQITFLDFDLSGYGWRVYDLAYYVTRIREKHRQPFLDGYESVRPLTDAEREMIPTIGRLAWIREEIGATALVKRLRKPYMTDL
ncbi:phosphotransferase enzyme family protein [Tenggerimyces flavus]|uniref:Phosphotransferase enzyme family protein n=1 Tax=Tenggerimyces flavus TaxID=1708749 RepID=A0ABV7Y534_9ACTN|nr:homoserine kinase [Tenggerimyces flavus]MBM7788529.1 Ser/Thr protein kinase RdoA (MazF antagonist) [Tenggerimyces flavus]